MHPPGLASLFDRSNIILTTTNRWSKDPKLRELGRWNQVRLHGGVEGYMLRLLTTALRWPYEEAQLFLAQMRTTLRDYKTNAYLPGTIVYARKPTDET